MPAWLRLQTEFDTNSLSVCKNGALVGFVAVPWLSREISCMCWMVKLDSPGDEVLATMVAPLSSHGVAWYHMHDYLAAFRSAVGEWELESRSEQHVRIFCLAEKVVVALVARQIGLAGASLA